MLNNITLVQTCAHRLVMPNRAIIVSMHVTLIDLNQLVPFITWLHIEIKKTPPSNTELMMDEYICNGDNNKTTTKTTTTREYKHKHSDDDLDYLQYIRIPSTTMTTPTEVYRHRLHSAWAMAVPVGC